MATNEDELVMYLVVNKALGMGPGKVGAQCGHAVEQLLVEHFTSASDGDVMDDWLRESRVKVVLAAEEDEWVELLDAVERLEVFGTVVVDEGRTEVTPGSKTVIGLWPRTRAQRPSVVAGMKRL